MAKLYEIPRETTAPELTSSLAQSLKDGIILPTEKKFSILEREIAALRSNMETDSEKLVLQVKDNFNRLDVELNLLKKFYRISTSLALASLAGIIAMLTLLISWY